VQYESLHNSVVGLTANTTTAM